MKQLTKDEIDAHVSKLKSLCTTGRAEVQQLLYVMYGVEARLPKPGEVWVNMKDFKREPWLITCNYRNGLPTDDLNMRSLITGYAYNGASLLKTAQFFLDPAQQWYCAADGVKQYAKIFW